MEAAEDLIHRWESNGDNYGGIEDYLQVVDHIIQLTEDLGLEQPGEAADGDVVDRAENALQLAMARLEEEFRHTLIRNTVPLDIERIDGSLIRRSSLSSSASADGIIHGYPMEYPILILVRETWLIIPLILKRKLAGGTIAR